LARLEKNAKNAEIGGIFAFSKFLKWKFASNKTQFGNFAGDAQRCIPR